VLQKILLFALTQKIGSCIRFIKTKNVRAKSRKLKTQAQKIGSRIRFQKNVLVRAKKSEAKNASAKSWKLHTILKRHTCKKSEAKNASAKMSEAAYDFKKMYWQKVGS
jgi:hypothetical protein